jgi:hypothetical protein
MDMPYLPLDQFLASQLSKTLPKHNPNQEDRIIHPYWNLDRSAMDKILFEISALAKAKLMTVPEEDKELTHLRDAAERITKISRKSPIRVALLGAQGAGKSLLINALFDLDGLSLTGADGGACTASVVRYVYYPGDNGKFLAEIKFLDSKKMAAMLQEHAKSYYDYHNDDDDSDDEIRSQSKADRQDEQERRVRDTAVDVFDTLFGSRQEFLESWDPRTYKNGEFVALCLLKCQEALDQIKASDDVMSFIRNDQTALLDAIKPFLTNVPGTQCLWPLVDSVCVRITHPLLQQGIEIIDLPGMLHSHLFFVIACLPLSGSGDTNSTRTRHADEIKDSVDVLIVLADTIRITTDDSFISKVRGGILTHGVDRVKLVATKIDVSPFNFVT